MITDKQGNELSPEQLAERDALIAKQQYMHKYGLVKCKGEVVNKFALKKGGNAVGEFYKKLKNHDKEVFCSICEHYWPKDDCLRLPPTKLQPEEAFVCSRCQELN